MKQELLEAIEKLLKAEIINAKEYTQMVIRVKSSNNSAQGEISNVSDNEKSKEIDCSSCRYNRSGNIRCISCGESHKNYMSID